MMSGGEAMALNLGAAISRNVIGVASSIEGINSIGEYGEIS